MELTVSIVLAALDGNEDALRVVLKYYERYIKSFVFEKYTDVRGNVRVHLDLDAIQQLHTQLLAAVRTYVYLHANNNRR